MYPTMVQKGPQEFFNVFTEPEVEGFKKVCSLMLSERATQLLVLTVVFSQPGQELWVDHQDSPEHLVETNLEAHSDVLGPYGGKYVCAVGRPEHERGRARVEG